MTARRTLYTGLRDDLVFEIETVLAVLRNGLHSSAQKGEGITYVGQRDFEEGDELRQVDVPRSLEKSPKFNELVTRLFEPERKIIVWIALDCTSGMKFPRKKTEIAMGLLWLSALSAFRRRDSVRILLAFDAKEGGCMCSDECYSVDDVNDFLLKVKDDEVVPVSEGEGRTTEFLGGKIPQDGFLVAVSDFISDGFLSLKEIEDLNADRHSRALFAIIDEWTGVVPPKGIFSALDNVSGAMKKFGKKEVEGLRGAALKRQEAIASTAEHSGNLVARIPIERDNPFEEVVRACGDH